MLEVRGIEAGYGRSRVLHGIDLEVRPGQVVALLGRNGMGKTTLLRVLMGLLRPTRGKVLLDGGDLTALRPFEISNLGLAYVPQGRELYPDFTVRDNLLLGVIAKRKLPFAIPDYLFHYFPVLAERLDQRAGTLSGGQQQQLTIARALIGRPRVLLLDEPSEGIQPSIVHAIATALRAISEKEGLATLLVEQNLDMALNAATTCLFMEKGGIVDRKTTVQVREDSAILARYLTV